jgi:hypothetical protein
VDGDAEVGTERRLAVFAFRILRHDGAVIFRRSHTSLQLKIVWDEIDEIKIKEQ